MDFTIFSCSALSNSSLGVNVKVGFRLPFRAKSRLARIKSLSEFGGQCSAIASY